MRTFAVILKLYLYCTVLYNTVRVQYVLLLCECPLFFVVSFVPRADARED
jgi:hypothetical protein